MTNKEEIQEVINELGLKMGGWDELVNSLSKKELKKVLENIEYQKDTDVKIKRKDYVVEIDIVEDEVDFRLLTRVEFINRYGDERYEHD